MTQEPSPSANPIFAAHSRQFTANRYVYPVLSRRAGGISIGVNLNPDKFCNFRCVYCQIDRTQPGCDEPVDLTTLADELDRMAELVVSGDIYRRVQFGNTPAALRRLNDIAFSGNGEPTACPNFDQAVEVAAEVRRRRKLDDVKLVLITNATLFHQPRVRRALEMLAANNGEIWAKLDAGTEEYYRIVDRSPVPWRRILDNLREAAIARPIVIQSLFLRIYGQPAPSAELDAYCDRLGEITAAGGRIKLVQVHTIARSPAESWATPLSNAEVDAIADLVRRRAQLPVAAFYGEGPRI
jgi:wyosine [tRNA(Phe)-imidazoG37] synthetase (radical SAM superfamily)